MKGKQNAYSLQQNKKFVLDKGYSLVSAEVKFLSTPADTLQFLVPHLFITLIYQIEPIVLQVAVDRISKPAGNYK